MPATKSCALINNILFEVLVVYMHVYGILTLKMKVHASRLMNS